MSVLELGCGNGRWIESLAPLVSRYVAVDYSETMLAIAADRVRAHRLTNVELVRAAAQEYAPTEQFDVVYLAGVSQYLHDDDLERMLRGVMTTLAPGGVIIDRSTIHRHSRTLSTQPSYFSIYRTAGELVSIYERAGAVNTYRAASYPFLSLTARMHRVCNWTVPHRLIAITAPVSLEALRPLAWLAGKWSPPTGELTDFTHDFFLFSPSAS